MKATLDIPLSAYEVAEAVGGKYFGKDEKINFICTDSRELERGGLFFALRGAEEYVSDAIKHVGCCAVSSCNTDAILVDDTEDALLMLAKYFKSKLSHLRITVAITGSVGKTCVKDYTAAIFAKKYKTHKTIGNYNNSIGLPLTVFSAPRDTEALILELGMNHSGEIRRLSEAVRPDIAVITCIGSAHIGNLGSREAIAAAKLEILCGMDGGSLTVIPKDEPLLSSVHHAVTVGNGGDVRISVISQSDSETRFKIIRGAQISEPIFFPFGGLHFAENFSFAAAAALASGFKMSEIISTSKNSFEFIPRQKFIRIGEMTVIDDSYNASPESYAASLKLLSMRRGTKSAVIGDMLELGEKSEELHRRTGALCKSLGIDRIYPFGKYAHCVKAGAEDVGFDSSAIFMNENAIDHERTAKEIAVHAAHGETVLIKGSHATHTEKIIEFLKKYEGDKNAF